MGQVCFLPCMICLCNEIAFEFDIKMVFSISVFEFLMRCEVDHL